MAGQAVHSCQVPPMPRPSCVGLTNLVQSHDQCLPTALCLQISHKLGVQTLPCVCPQPRTTTPCLHVAMRGLWGNQHDP